MGLLLRGACPGHPGRMQCAPLSYTILPKKALSMYRLSGFFVVPRKTTSQEVFAGARWPRDDPLPFRDVRPTPRIRDFEVDGVELGLLRVIPKDKGDAVGYHIPLQSNVS